MGVCVCFPVAQNADYCKHTMLSNIFLHEQKVIDGMRRHKAKLGHVLHKCQLAGLGRTVSLLSRVFFWAGPVPVV